MYKWLTKIKNWTDKVRRWAGYPACGGVKPITILEVNSEDFQKNSAEILNFRDSHYWVRVISEGGGRMTIMGLADLDECSGCTRCDWQEQKYIYKKYGEK